MKTVCNPLNLEYRYNYKSGSYFEDKLFREAADPTMLLFQDTYFLFASMSGGFWYSDDLCHWQFKETPELPIYDYAPDVRVVGGAVIFSASKRGEPCTFYKSENPLTKPFVSVSSPFDFWDPAIFQDDDGKVYLYWGCTNNEPIWGIEMDPNTLTPIGEKIGLIDENTAVHFWEHSGENNRLQEPKTDLDRKIREHVGTKPFIEGAYMTKYAGRYYLQYAAPGTEYNIYSDGVYIGNSPLGPFAYQEHNPFSSKPGGFITGAGHGSTFQDKQGNWWHVSTMRISVHDNFERRIGLFPCDFDKDGLLYCDQNFADYPFLLPEVQRKEGQNTEPIWMLLSYQKTASASSSQKGHTPEQGVNEDIRTWWAAGAVSEEEWYQIDLGSVKEVYAVQINFADCNHEMPWIDVSRMHQESMGLRYIETKAQRTAYVLEGSADAQTWISLKDRHAEEGDYSHDFIVMNESVQLRYLRVSKMVLPYRGVPAISGLRVFGSGTGDKPQGVKSLKAIRLSDGSIELSWASVSNADGYNIRYGIAEDKLYASWQVYGETHLNLTTINTDKAYYIAVDSFNENGVTQGKIITL